MMIVAVCTIAGNLTSSVVASTIIYLASHFPANRPLLKSEFVGILFIVMVFLSAFFGAVASMLVVLSHGQPTERSAWLVVLAIPFSFVFVLLIQEGIGDAAGVFIFGVFVACGMHVSKQLGCRLR